MGSSCFSAGRLPRSSTRTPDRSVTGPRQRSRTPLCYDPEYWNIVEVFRRSELGAGDAVAWVGWWMIAVAVDETPVAVDAFVDVSDPYRRWDGIGAVDADCAVFQSDRVGKVADDLDVV